MMSGCAHKVIMAAICYLFTESKMVNIVNIVKMVNFINIVNVVNITNIVIVVKIVKNVNTVNIVNIEIQRFWISLRSQNISRSKNF